MADMARRAVETYFDETLGKWTNRLEGGSAVGYAFSDKVEAVSRGGCLAEYLGVRQVVLRGPRGLIGPSPGANVRRRGSDSRRGVPGR